MELPEFKAKKKDDLLADSTDALLGSTCEETFFFLISQKLRGQRGKTYKNMDRRLPLDGAYQELEVNGPQDSRRIIIDTKSFDVFATRDHYKTISYAGKPNWAR